MSSRRERLIGIQVGPISFYDEGVDQVLDRLESLSGVNAIMVGTLGYDTAVTVPPDGRYADHGQRPRDTAGKTLAGGWTRFHPQYYSATMIQDPHVRDEEFRESDVLSLVRESAAGRGIRVFSWLRENGGREQVRGIAGFPKVCEIDIFGRRGIEACVNHPDYRNWWLSVIEDHLKSYPIDGFLFNVERRGPLGEALTRLWGPEMRAAVPTCFCEHCRSMARDRGIDAERAREGYRALWSFRQDALHDKRLTDGYFVVLLRLLLRFPEVLAWNRMWAERMNDLRAEMYGVVKAIDESKQIGWHIFHENTFSPLCRAENDFAEFVNFSDFIKPVVYNVCAGTRFSQYVRSVGEVVGRDSSTTEVSRLIYQLMGWEEADLDDLPAAGFSPDYVRREISRAVEAVGDRIPIYSGIDVDVPSGEGGRQAQPGDITAATVASFEGGASGLIISRAYHEMNLDNLAGVRRGLELVDSNNEI